MLQTLRTRSFHCPHCQASLQDLTLAAKLRIGRAPDAQTSEPQVMLCATRSLGNIAWEKRWRMLYVKLRRDNEYQDPVSDIERSLERAEAKCRTMPRLGRLGR